MKNDMKNQHRAQSQWWRYGIFICMGLFFLLILGRAPTASSLDKPGAPDHPPVHPNEKILQGIDLLYNLQFEEAEALFQQVVDDSPDKPAGYFYLAMVSWSRMVAGFWSPENVHEYKRRIDRITRIAKKRINQNGDSEDYFYLGGALGFLGRFELMQKNWFRAFLTARKALKALKTCAEMAPHNRDVLLGLGTYDYYTAKLSGVLRFLSKFLLHKPNKEEGISISEFPTTMEAAQNAKSLGMHTILGAPNMVRGESHSGNISAGELAETGLLDGFSSDYMPISLLHAAFVLHERVGVALPSAVATVTANIAEMVQLEDRGTLEVGKKADIIRVQMMDGLPLVKSIWKNGRLISNLIHD